MGMYQDIEEPVDVIVLFEGGRNRLVENRRGGAQDPLFRGAG
jgi:hypothetical protein